jgi:hypothetical protein
MMDDGYKTNWAPQPEVGVGVLKHSLFALFSPVSHFTSLLFNVPSAIITFPRQEIAFIDPHDHCLTDEFLAE